MEPYGLLPPIHLRSLDSISRRSPFAPQASMLVSCIRCKRLHSTIQPFEFNPVCPSCAGRLGSLRA
jgi:hypothetical protein